ncbi:MAG: nucleoside recognition protein [Bacteroidetes bacterium]|nr:nucleoside recognition protein [Bacteroidota bacterium]
MLNYVWAGLIILSFVFGLAYDARDLSRDTYRNGLAFEVELTSDLEFDASLRRQNVTVHIDPAFYKAHYNTESTPDSTFSGVIIRSTDGIQLRFAEGATLPDPWSTIRLETSSRDNDMRGTFLVTSTGLAAQSVPTDSTGLAASAAPNSVAGTVTFRSVRFVKMHAIAAAAISMAETAVTLALGLVGVIALWMGLLKIAEAAGLINTVVRFTQPILRPLFPEIPKDHPALGLIVLNLSANMLGLGNAATPLGIKAMEELQTLNPDPDTATNSMVMLLAMNTASVQLVPPVLLVALMGLQINELIFAITIVTSISLIVAVLSARLLSKMKRFQTKPAGPNTPQSLQTN